MKKDKILLLCDIPPCENYTGGKMISQLLDFLIEEKYDVDCFCTLNKYLKPKYNMTSESITLKIYDRPDEKLVMNTEKEYYELIEELKDELVKYVKENKITKIWCPLQGEVLTLLVNHVYNKTKIPYVLEIWDPIEWWMKDNEFSDERKEKTLLEVEKAFKNSKKVITTSIEMSKYLTKKYKTSCIEVMPPLRRKEYYNISKSKDKFIISMAGQVYASEELDVFLTALDSLKWKINKKDVYFEHYGLWKDSYIDFTKHEKYKDRIILKGFVEQDELLNQLSNSNLLYCPYFFSTDEELKQVAEISFPSKVITYLAIDVPILYHGPDYSGPYKFLDKNNCALLIPSTKTKDIVEVLNSINTKKCNEIIKNAKKTFENNFTYEIAKDNFYKALDLKYDGKKKLRILEVNNLDLPGRRFNGYDLLDVINDNTPHTADQIVTYKDSDHPRVYKFYKDQDLLSKEWSLIGAESSELSVHSQLSFTSNILKNNELFKKADVVHYHLIHNTKLSLSQMIELCSDKPSVLTFHDPWNFTGRCAYPQECEKWKTGCKNCQFLDNLFPFTQDNCNSLWKLKKKVYEHLDVDIIISTPFMQKMIDECPLTQCLKHIHILPFGIDLDKFSAGNKKKARERFGIKDDEIVLFFRAQMAMKGTEYIVEAMKMLETDKKITLLSCSEKGLLEDLKSKYRVIDLGNIGDEEMKDAYSACDVFLMPSRGESFGLMAIEAMASSRPIVVFNNTALPYVTFAPECGVLVENKNSEKLMEAIKMLIDDPKERERRGKLGRQLAEEHYDLNKYNKRLVEIYEEVYERQKNKKIITKDTNTINPENEDIKELVPKLERVYKTVFGNKTLPYEILKYKDENYVEKENYKIDYSSWDVINLIELFNKEIYIKLWEFYNISSKRKFAKLLFYLKNDRGHLYDAVGNRLKKHPVLHKAYWGTFEFAANIKRGIDKKRKKK